VPQQPGREILTLEKGRIPEEYYAFQFLLQNPHETTTYSDEDTVHTITFTADRHNILAK
jgi:hypothetical protein